MKDTKTENSDSIILTDNEEAIQAKTSQSETLPRIEKPKIENRVIVSCQDIRNLVSTLYLKSLPGLEDIIIDFDILIDEYYEPVRVTD